jgi:hypothetical protein
MPQQPWKKPDKPIVYPHEQQPPKITPPSWGQLLILTTILGGVGGLGIHTAITASGVIATVIPFIAGLFLCALGVMCLITIVMNTFSPPSS